MTSSTIESTAASNEQEFVVIRLGNESYAIAITSVREIIRMQRITKIPLTANDVVGLTKLRDLVIPVAELRRTLGLHDEETSAETRIVVVDTQSDTIGLVVDEVTAVITTSQDAIEPLASTIDRGDSAQLLGVINRDDQLILVVDIDKIIGGITGRDAGLSPSSDDQSAEPEPPVIDLPPSGASF